MAAVKDVLDRIDTITFDCYGTLIDWRAGLESALLEVFGAAIMPRMPEVFDAYVAEEAAVEAQSYQSYKDVLSAVTARLAARFGIPLSPERSYLMAELLPRWKPFPDTNDALARLKSRYRLGILSNIDEELFAATARQFPVAFDFVITAAAVGSYKPGLSHFERLFEQHGGPDRVLHVAQSLFHDGEPAAKLDLAYVWINRYNEANESAVPVLAEYADLTSLADAACG